MRRDVSESDKLELKLDAARLPEDIQGPAELKVKCKTEGKLRIIVDGHDSGMTCPTETLSVSPGKHTLTFVNVADGSLNEKKLKVKRAKAHQAEGEVRRSQARRRLPDAMPGRVRLGRGYCAGIGVPSRAANSPLIASRAAVTMRAMTWAAGSVG